MAEVDLRLKDKYKQGAHGLDPQVLESIEALAGWNLDGPRQDLDHLPEDWTDAIEVELKRFLALIIISRADPDLVPRDQVAPSQLVDLLWHGFIVYTESYQDFCESHAGGFIHHAPAGPHSSGDDALAAQMREHLDEFFYDVDEAIWSGRIGDCWPNDI